MNLTDMKIFEFTFYCKVISISTLISYMIIYLRSLIYYFIIHIITLRSGYNVSMEMYSEKKIVVFSVHILNTDF